MVPDLPRAGRGEARGTPAPFPVRGPAAPWGAGFAAAAPSPRSAYRFLLSWAAAWAAVGIAVASVITFSAALAELIPVILISVLFAEILGFTALTSCRLIFPYFTRLPYAVRIVLQVLTLFSGTAFGSALAISSRPLYFLARPRLVAVVILVNAAVGVIVGISLHTYDSMRLQIEQSFRALREKEAMEREVEIAREVQQELFPRSVPTVSGLEMAGICLPAIGIGGDYYDFLPMDEERVGLVIADVSGKGIPAALLMASVQALVRGLFVPTVPVSELNQRLNDILYRSTSPSRYATLFSALWDGRSRTLTYSNAGHNPPLQFGSGGLERLSSGGIPLGVLGNVRYEQERRPLSAGDLLALYTDGVTEATNQAGREFGEQRLVSTLSRHRHLPLDELVGAVLRELETWLGGHPPQDDVTLVLARAL